MSKKIRHRDRNRNNEEVFVEVSNGCWICPACNEKAKDIYSICPDCGQPIRFSEEPIVNERTPEDRPEYKLMDRAGNWALALGFLGAALAIFAIITLKAGDPIFRNVGYLDGTLNLATSLLSIFWGSKAKVVSDNQIRVFSCLIALYIFKLLSLGLGLILVGPQPTRFFVLSWALIVFVRGQNAAKKIQCPQGKK